MDWILELIANPFLLTGLTSWFFAQVLKTIIHAVINKKIVWERLVGDGGMPSGHSATVTSIAVLAALRCGPGSYEFAIAGILAIIVCHDAMGVRLETGKQAQIINELTKNPDGYRTSTYFYKDADSDILTVGPIWDYDLSFGRSWGCIWPFSSRVKLVV